MKNLQSIVLATIGATLLAACSPGGKVDTAAEEAAVRAVNVAWGKAFAEDDAAGVAALYADDAVLSAPGRPSVRGKEAIQEAIAQEIAMVKAAGLTITNEPSSEVGVSGDMAWEAGGYSVKDSSGATVDSGKFAAVFAKRDGSWKMIHDVVHSSSTPPAGGSGAALRVVQFTAASAAAQQAAMKLVDEEINPLYDNAKGFQWVKYFIDPKTLETGSVSLWSSAADIDTFLNSEGYKPIPGKIKPLTKRGMNSRVFEVHTPAK
jgi:uncharacterized protein (TIGR02246 family)